MVKIERDFHKSQRVKSAFSMVKSNPWHYKRHIIDQSKNCCQKVFVLMSGHWRRIITYMLSEYKNDFCSICSISNQFVSRIIISFWWFYCLTGNRVIKTIEFMVEDHRNIKWAYFLWITFQISNSSILMFFSKFSYMMLMNQHWLISFNSIETGLLKRKKNINWYMHTFCTS